MKKRLLCVAGLALLVAACTPKQKGVAPKVLTDGIRVNECVLLHDGKLLVTSFGTDEVLPLNEEGKGYILAFDGNDTVPEILVAADGTLSAPKGMRVHDRRLYVADVNKLVVFNLDSLAERTIVRFPAGEMFVNDLDFRGDRLYVSVTNTGNIYTLDTDVPGGADSSSLTLWANVPGANGVLFNGDTLYVASYPADGVTTEANVIYAIRDLADPAPEKLIDRPGQYDGLALSDDGMKLYFTNWTGGEVGVIELATGALTPLETGVPLTGVARLVQAGGVLYIPDMVNSKVVEYTLPE